MAELSDERRRVIEGNSARDVPDLLAEIDRLRAAIADAAECFYYMPHLNGAVSDSTCDEVRAECDRLIGEALDILHPAIGRRRSGR